MFIFLLLILLFLFPIIVCAIDNLFACPEKNKPNIQANCKKQDISFESFHESITVDNLTNRTVKLIPSKSLVYSIQVWLPKEFQDAQIVSKIDIFSDKEQKEDTKNQKEKVTQSNILTLRLLKFSDGVYTDLLSSPISISPQTTSKKVLEFNTQFIDDCTLHKDDVIILQRQYENGVIQLPNLIKVGIR
jgi:hypothetical protein